jgi:hypothetical protein
MGVPQSQLPESIHTLISEIARIEQVWKLISPDKAPFLFKLPSNRFWGWRAMVSIEVLGKTALAV